MFDLGHGSLRFNLSHQENQSKLEVQISKVTRFHSYDLLIDDRATWRARFGTIANKRCYLFVPSDDVANTSFFPIKRMATNPSREGEGPFWYNLAIYV